MSIELPSLHVEAHQERTRSSSETGIEMATLDVAEERTSSQNEKGIEYVPESTRIDSHFQQNTDFDQQLIDVSTVKPASPVSLEQPEAELAADAAHPSSSTQVTTDGESPIPNGVEFHKASTAETTSASFPHQADTVDERPAKRARKIGTLYSGRDAVAVVLGQTAEIVLVLARMAQMRAGRLPTSYERECAATAYENLRLLVSRVAPNNFVSKTSVERVIQEIKTLAHKMRQDKAWEDSLREAEALVKAKEEALAKEKAEAERLVRSISHSVSRSISLSLSLSLSLWPPRSPIHYGSGFWLLRWSVFWTWAGMVIGAPGLLSIQSDFSVSGGAAAIQVNGRRNVDLPYVSGPTSSGQSTREEGELVESPNFPRPAADAAHHSSEGQISLQALVSESRVGDVPRSETEKSMSLNEQSQQLAYKPALGRPPKVRNRSKKDVSPVTLFTPEFLNLTHNQTPEPQKAQVTHKQLCLGVQQFIREHIPPISQTLQALPPTYISKPFPCQVCNLIAKDTGSVLVCDLCDEVSHVKCVQPLVCKGATRGDWNCPKCLIACGGGKYPSKYGPIHRGSPNSVKLWPPHDVIDGNSEPMVPVANSVARLESGSTKSSGQISDESLKVQEIAKLGVDTEANHSKDGPVIGTSRSLPHLIVDLVNEASPRNSDHLLKEHSPGSYLLGRQLSTVIYAQSEEPKFLDSLTAEGETQLQRESGTQVSDQLDCLRLEELEEKSGFILEKNDALSMVEDERQKKTNSQGARPVEEGEGVTKADDTIEIVDSAKGLSGPQSDVPLPIMMEWVGPSIQRAEGKLYYRACCVGGITFSLSDCALFHPETPDVPPYIARLQVLWEDMATGYKWVRVSWCYYPSDIPLAMGHPGTTEPNEVYESNHCDNNLVGSIQGPCFVLPPQKYYEETGRRNLLRRAGNMLEGLPPLFLSRWMYDAPKGVFKPFQGGYPE